MKVVRILLVTIIMLLTVSSISFADPRNLSYIESVEVLPDRINMGDDINVTLKTRGYQINDAIVDLTLTKGGGTFAPVGEIVSVNVTKTSDNTFKGKGTTPGNGWGTWTLSSIKLNVKYSDGKIRSHLITYQDLKNAKMDLSIYAENDLIDDYAAPVTNDDDDEELRAPTFTAPASNAYLDKDNINVTWGRVSEASKYLIKVKDVTNNNYIVQETETSQISYTISRSSLTEGHDYEITISSKRNSETKSTSRRFSIKTTPVVTQPIQTPTQPQLPLTPAQQNLPTPLKLGESTTKFRDIEGHWAKASILTLINKGSIAGYSDGTFKPNNSITRAEFIKILVKALGKQSTETATGFKDVPSGHWAAKEITAAKKLNITSGYAGGVFKPNSNITRAEIVSMICSAKKLSAGQGKVFFSDVKDSHWAKPSIMLAASHSIVSGYQDMTFKPNKNATRAEACRMIEAMLNK